ncbi:PilZ-like domain-containing protein [Geobacter sp.]|uniref:PilZ-like domain-containing protein n=1 Tax=Geobacter sp. TaxID=46610 RepID=UPI0027BA67D2|nr:PilZ-like domain-containing protein [Geobacter sp.]
MKEEFSDYQKYFGIGLRVEVRFPRAQEEPFSDGAIISMMDEDLVKLQLSRDILPENVKTETGTTIDIRGGKEGSAHCCRAIIVEEWDGTLLNVRLIGNVIPDEMREFYRIETYIPIRYRLEPDTSPEQIREQWHARRYSSPHPAEGALPLNQGSEHLPLDEPASASPLAANLSGSGIRIRIHEELPTAALVPMELYLQLETLKTVPIVGEVVQVSPLHTREGDAPLFSTALRFTCIDERDRDAVIRFISREQLARLRSHQGSVSISSLDYEAYSRQKNVQRIVLVIGIVLIVAAIAAALVLSRLNSPKGEIEQTFEREIQKYRKLMPWR